MRYCSTRGGVKGLSFEDALMRGYANDGGMLLPEEIPNISLKQLQEWSTYSYENIVTEICKLFIDPSEIPEVDLHDIITKAYTKFPSEERIKISHLKDGLKIAELYHGPTMAFKDLPMVCVGQMMEYFLAKRNKRATVIVCTSGDTGGSAIMSTKGLTCVDMIVLYPKGRCNEVQELQMITALEDNIHCFAVDGSSDEEDEAMIDVICDIEFASTHNLGAMNSLNWARIMVQIAHFVYIYLNGEIEIGEPLQLIVPSGGAGNLTAGCIAYLMGLPIRLVAAVNENKVIHTCLQEEGILAIGESAIVTLASAMDIQVPYNFERIIYLFSGNDGQLVDQLMKTYLKEKSVAIPRSILSQIKSVITSSSSSDNAAIIKAIKRCWRENNYMICPHTAAAVSCYYNSLDLSHPTPGVQVCIATASPFKFPEVMSACGLEVETSFLKDLRSKKTKFEIMARGQDWKAMLRQKIQNITMLRMANLNGP